MQNLVTVFGNFIKFNLLFPVLVGIEKVIAGFSKVGNYDVFDSGAFPWTQFMEENWQDIRKELDQVLQFHTQLPNLQDIQQEQNYITQDNHWKTFFFYGFGEKAEKNCMQCPRTAELIENIPGMITALFSILSPGKHIPRHRGVYKGIIRSHLALKIPGKKGDCRMQIGKQLVEWEEGKMVVFDNTYFHEVWNDTDEIRVILMIDIIRPFPYPLSVINKSIIKLISWSSFVKSAMKKHRTWEKQFHEKVERRPV